MVAGPHILLNWIQRLTSATYLEVDDPARDVVEYGDLEVTPAEYGKVRVNQSSQFEYMNNLIKPRSCQLDEL